MDNSILEIVGVALGFVMVLSSVVAYICHEVTNHKNIVIYWMYGALIMCVGYFLNFFGTSFNLTYLSSLGAFLQIFGFFYYTHGISMIVGKEMPSRVFNVLSIGTAVGILYSFIFYSQPHFLDSVVNSFSYFLICTYGVKNYSKNLIKLGIEGYFFLFVFWGGLILGLARIGMLLYVGPENLDAFIQITIFYMISLFLVIISGVIASCCYVVKTV